MFVSHRTRLRPENSVLVVVDLQEPLLRVIHDRERLMGNVRLLIESANVLGIPIVATTQNAERLGELPVSLTELLPPDAPILNKMAFSCWGVVEPLLLPERRQVVLCGVETHICISQTALDLKANGFDPHVVADATSARTLEKHKLGMERIRDSDALPCAAEAAVYEWLGDASRPEFKAILAIVKSLPT